MNMDKKRLRVVSALAITLMAASFGVACAAGDEFPADVRSILIERCSSCHSTTVAEYWYAPSKAAAESMLDDMVAKGAVLPADERAVLIEFFAK